MRRPPLPPPPASQAITFRRSDGTVATGTLYLPALADRVAAIVEITPYRPHGATYEGEAGYWTAAGYAFAVFDCRGQNGSEGQFRLFEDDARDGAAALAWIAAQDWCDGRIAMRGSSYTGTNQLQIAAHGAPSLNALTPSCTGDSIVRELFHTGGAFSLRWTLSWPARLSDSGLPPDAPIDLNAAERAAPLGEADLASVGTRLVIFQQAVASSVAGHEGWKADIVPHEQGASITQPCLMFTGWWDGTLSGTLANFDKLPAGRKHLIVGPWEHQSAPDGGYHYVTGAPITQVGDIDVPPAGFLDGLDLTRRWYDWALRGKTAPDLPVAKIWVTGADRWLDLPEYPPPSRATPLYLHEDRLDWDTPAAHETPARYRYDPAHPVPSEPRDADGSTRPMLSLPIDMAWLAQRDDVVTLQTSPITEPVPVIGRVEFVLHVASTARDTDFVAILFDIDCAGRMIKLGSRIGGATRARYREGYEREVLLEPGKAARIVVDLGHIGHVFAAGHRIAVAVTSSMSPHLAPNRNTGNPVGTDTAPAVVAEQTLYRDAVRPSHVVLPLVTL